MAGNIKREIVRYEIAGCFIAAADYTFLYLLTEFAGVPYLWSNAAAFLLSALLNYLFGAYYIFSSTYQRKSILPFLSWLILSLLRLAGCQFILWLATDRFGLYYMISKVISMLFSHIYNFIAQKLLFQRATTEP